MIVEFSIALCSIYGFADMKYVFYSMLKTALNLNDVQLGSIWGIFGIIAMISYIGGGILVDRIAPVSLVSSALFFSGILHGCMAMVSLLPTRLFFCNIILFKLSKRNPGFSYLYDILCDYKYDNVCIDRSAL